MLSMLKRLVGSSTQVSRRPARAGTRTGRQPRLALEALEDRLLLSVAAGPQGQIYSTWNSNQHLYERSATTGAWADQNAIGVTSVSVGANGAEAAVFSDSSLREYNASTNSWAVIARDVGLAAVGPQGQLYFTSGLKGQLMGWNPTTKATTAFSGAAGVTSLSAGANGTLDAIFSGGTLKQLNAAQTAWATLGTGLVAVTDGPHGESFATYGSSNALWEYTAAAGWQYRNASGVSALSEGANGVLDAVFSANGALWQYNTSAGSWGPSAVYTGSVADPAGPTLQQKVVMFGLDHLAQAVSDPGLTYPSGSPASLIYSCAAFVSEDLTSVGAKSFTDFPGNFSTLDYVWGNLVVQHNAGGPLSDFNAVQPGDIIQFTNVVTPNLTATQHTAVVEQNLGNGKFLLLDQNDNGRLYVTENTFDLSDMTSGYVKIYSPV
jgi:hypothetical protein